MRMGSGEINHRTFSQGIAESNSGLEGKLIPFKIDSNLLKQGENVIAVSVHQRHGASSDLVLDLEILALSKLDFVRLQRKRTED